MVLNRNAQFQNAYRNGKSFVSPLVVTYVLPRRRGTVRYGITASKKVGCAVKRNRARRVIKAAATELLPHVLSPCDIVFVARKATAETKSTAVRQVLLSHLRKSGVFSDGV